MRGRQGPTDLGGRLGRQVACVFLGLLSMGMGDCEVESISVGLVTITSPESGTVYTIAQTVMIEADVQEALESRVTKVEFYDAAGDDVPKCIDATGPDYECAWSVSETDNGVYPWKARAYFDNGKSDVSTAVELTVRINSGGPELVGFVPGVGDAMDVEVVGTKAFVASAQFGLSVLDVANPDAPKILGASGKSFCGPRGAPYCTNHLTVRDHLAVIAGGKSGRSAELRVIDVADATKPRVVGELVTSSVQGLTTTGYRGFWDVALDETGTKVIAAMGADGIWVIDVSKPAEPSLIGMYDTPGTAHGVALQGTLAYVAGGDGGLQVLSFATPSKPSLVGSLNLNGSQWGIAVAEGNAYLTTHALGGLHGSITVVDVSNPAAPSSLGASAVLNGTGYRVDAEGTRLAVRVYGAGGYNIDILDVSNPASPQNLGQFHSQEVGLAGGFAYGADGPAGVKIYDVSSSTPSPRGQYTDRPAGRSIDAGAGLAIVAGANRGESAHLRVVDVAAPTAPRVAGVLETSLTQGPTATGPRGFQDVALDETGTLVIAAMGADGIWVIDVSEPAEPSLIGMYDTPGSAYGVALQGTLAYVAGGEKGLQVLSFANPSQPSLVGNLELAGTRPWEIFSQRDIAVAGDRAYLATYGRSITVVDVSNPAAPTSLGMSAVLNNSGHELAAEGTRLAAFTMGAGGFMVEILDVSNPVSPQHMGQFHGQGVALAGGFVYASEKTSGDATLLNIYDVSGPAPSLVTSVPTVGEAFGVAVDGGYVYVADSVATLDVIKLAP